LANREHFNKDKEKNKRKSFKELEELKEKPIYNNTNKEIQVIKPVEEDDRKDSKN
jgi:hypothetical protein